MNPPEFLYFRKKLGKSQRRMAELLGTSLKAVHSYEQGWRRIPAHAERQVLYLVAKKEEGSPAKNACWEVKKCPSALREKCPAWEFQSGRLCWFINGTVCEGVVHKDWRAKMHICRKCEVLGSLFPPSSREAAS
jgi:hypothetical protein